MIIRPDMRRFEDDSDTHGQCRKCGHLMVLLPDDKRHGYCFDCIDFLEISNRQEISEGRVFTVNLTLPKIQQPDFQ